MGQTPILHLPYPEIAAPADVPADIKALATALDKPAPPARPFRIIAGINAGLTLPYTSPAGWTMAKGGAGVYTVTVAVPLPLPIVAQANIAGGAQAPGIYTAMWDYSVSTATFLRFVTFYGQTLTDAGFSFLVFAGADPGG